MSDILKYHKYKNYICEIDIFENISEPINLNKLYTTSKCKINRIINMIDNMEIEKIDENYYKGSNIEKTIKIYLYDLLFDMPDIKYFYSYFRCFYFNFIENKQYLLFNNFCGTCDVYTNEGDFIKTILINNNDLIELK